MENKENSYRRCFVGCVGMERPNGAGGNSGEFGKLSALGLLPTMKSDRHILVVD